MPKRMGLKSIKHLGYAIRVSETDLVRLEGAISQDEQQHYQCWTEPKKNSGERSITAPKPWLKNVQRKINEYLQTLELPESIHGGRRKRSPLTNAHPHRFAEVLVLADIQDFYPSVRSGRIYDTFVHDQDCSPDVAHLLTRIVTYKGSLPQGAPTSPMVAALVAVRMVSRVSNLATTRGGSATLFVDDWTVSEVRQAESVCKKMKQIIRTERFTPHPDKTVVVSEHNQRVVTGVRVGFGSTDVPRELIGKIKSAINDIPDTSSLDCEEHIASIRGRIGQLRRLNPGSAKYYERQLLRAERSIFSCSAET